MFAYLTTSKMRPHYSGHLHMMVYTYHSLTLIVYTCTEVYCVSQKMGEDISSSNDAWDEDITLCVVEVWVTGTMFWTIRQSETE